VTNLSILSKNVFLNHEFEYLKFLENVQKQSVLSNTILMDETKVYLKDPCRTTIDMTKAKHMLLQTTRFAFMRMRVVLALKVDGSKITPLVILKDKDNLIKKSLEHGLFIKARLG
jgi:hypothetical protein